MTAGATPVCPEDPGDNLCCNFAVVYQESTADIISEVEKELLL